jgi:hypothetical protein
LSRWNVDSETKQQLNDFKEEIQKSLNCVGFSSGSLSQDGLLRLFIKHKARILDVIIAEEAAINNDSGPVQGSVPA